MQPAYDVSLYRKLFWHNYQLAVPVKPSPTIKTQPSADVFRRRGLIFVDAGWFDGYDPFSPFCLLYLLFHYCYFVHFALLLI